MRLGFSNLFFVNKNHNKIIAAFLAILITGILSSTLGHSAVPLMIASMGASSVLLFAAPHSPMAQPWSFVGGHLISALIGVTCFNRLLKKSENHPNPSFRRKPESRILLILLFLISWTPAFAGVTKSFSATC